MVLSFTGGIRLLAVRALARPLAVAGGSGPFATSEPVTAGREGYANFALAGEHSAAMTLILTYSLFAESAARTERGASS